MRRNIVKEKSYLFALRIVKLQKYLNDNKNEFVLSKQVLRCGTSIGALIRESEHAESRSDFIHKLSIALKEANETDYWLNILKDSSYINKRMFESLDKDCKEVVALLTAILKTTKTR